MLSHFVILEWHTNERKEHDLSYYKEISSSEPSSREQEGNDLGVVTMSAERFHSCISRGILGAKQLACFRGLFRGGNHPCVTSTLIWRCNGNQAQGLILGVQQSCSLNTTKKRCVSVKCNKQ
jgi:hypothetical protein